jgi:hypothetical protein
MELGPPSIRGDLVCGTDVREEVDVGGLAAADALEPHRLRVRVPMHGWLTRGRERVRGTVVCV